MDYLVFVFDQFDVAPDKQVLTLRTKTHLIERPPSFEWIARSKEPQFAAIGLWERHCGEESAFGHSDKRLTLVVKFVEAR